MNILKIILSTIIIALGALLVSCAGTNHQSSNTLTRSTSSNLTLPQLQREKLHLQSKIIEAEERDQYQHADFVALTKKLRGLNQRISSAQANARASRDRKRYEDLVKMQTQLKTELMYFQQAPSKYKNKINIRTNQLKALTYHIKVAGLEAQVEAKTEEINQLQPNDDQMEISKLESQIDGLNQQLDSIVPKLHDD